MKRILVGLGTSVHAESVVSHAIEIAQTQGAELLGIAVVDPRVSSGQVRVLSVWV